jgi:hypothetical protein
MVKWIGRIAVFAGVASFVQAAVPEIDPSSGISAIVLLSGALLVIRGRRK